MPYSQNIWRLILIGLHSSLLRYHNKRAHYIFHFTNPVDQICDKWSTQLQYWILLGRITETTKVGTLTTLYDAYIRENNNCGFRSSSMRMWMMNYSAICKWAQIFKDFGVTCLRDLCVFEMFSGALCVDLLHGDCIVQLSGKIVVVGGTF